jgi:hypothetical protein
MNLEEPADSSWLPFLLKFVQNGLVKLKAKIQDLIECFTEKAPMIMNQLPNLKSLQISMADNENGDEVLRTVSDIVRTAEGIVNSCLDWVKIDNNYVQYRVIGVVITATDVYVKDLFDKFNTVVWQSEFFLFVSCYCADDKRPLIPLFRNYAGHAHSLKVRKDFNAVVTKEYLGFIIMVTYNI